MNITADWLDEHRAGEQQRFLTLVAASFVVHVALVAVAAFAPAPSVSRLPDVVRVDLVALPAPAAQPKASAPAPAARPRPAPKARPVPKQVVLPKQAPAAVPKKPVPKAVAPPVRPEPIEYEDAMSQLRAELGETAPVPVETQSQAEASAQAADASAADAAGEAAAEATLWQRDVIRHLRSCWITPPEFLSGNLSTGLEVRMTGAGGVLGEPHVFRGSGDPYFDENAVRAVMRCAPLPQPPDAGSWRFNFTSEAR